MGAQGTSLPSLYLASSPTLTIGFSLQFGTSQYTILHKTRGVLIDKGSVSRPCTAPLSPLLLVLTLSLPGPNLVRRPLDISSPPPSSPDLPLASPPLSTLRLPHAHKGDSSSLLSLFPFSFFLSHTPRPPRGCASGRVETFVIYTLYFLHAAQNRTKVKRGKTSGREERRIYVGAEWDKGGIVARREGEGEVGERKRLSLQAS